MEELDRLFKESFQKLSQRERSDAFCGLFGYLLAHFEIKGDKIEKEEICKYLENACIRAEKLNNR